MRKPLQTSLLAALLLAGFHHSALAADSKPPAAAGAPGASDGFHLPPFPADAHVAQSTTVDGHTLKYTVTVGTLPVRDETGKVIAQVMFTAYTMPGRNRPVT
ncbi:MAG: peptidase S10, partial [Xanthomonadaceae bacterium]|nr:peptidase S10 [Xanthomonadaceae bacterium]